MIRQRATRRPTAAALPPMIAILRCVSGSERVARAITTALSPDNRISMLVIRSRSTKNRAAPDGTRVDPHFPSLQRGRRRPRNGLQAYVRAIWSATYNRIGTVPPDSRRLTIVPGHPPFELGVFLPSTSIGARFPVGPAASASRFVTAPASTRISTGTEHLSSLLRSSSACRAAATRSRTPLSGGDHQAL